MIVTLPRSRPCGQMGELPLPALLPSLPRLPDWMRNADWKGILLVAVFAFIVYRALFSRRARERRRRFQEAETKAKSQYRRQVAKLKEQYPML